MAEWLVEDGIAEERAILLHNDEILAARIEWPGCLKAGQVEDAVLLSRRAQSSRGTARFANGEEALVSRLPGSAREGAPIRLEVTRAAIGESGRFKLAQARPTTLDPSPAPSLAEQLRRQDLPVRTVRQFPGNDWDELVGEALAGEVAFPGGSLLFSPTPAMLLVDIDGHLPPRELAIAAIAPLARSLRRFDVGGSVGVDFPTLSAKEDRRAVDAELGSALADWPHERTAMNGFGFVQLVARLERPSILQLARFRRKSLAVRQLLRRAERLEGAGLVELRGHPALEAYLKPEWLQELARRTGREIRWHADPGLAIEAPHSQLVTP
ncbi:hypothetical protein FHS61_002380 [Altererythrobacter atlanticus]|uniref:Uncharacterized protein n=1 Tax=Croceibacterium atlanticum TaxID=1267766 RepID=A0A0F7KSH3_9SPHN|nr:hypothetical protein [Croceibacterium atlanticum]AKH42086.1 hypothetical protein WYH_01038 [Croceibacterium atlanticum]MBB5733345.1 hypothetical protein [Croceibacterium atlanticum]